MFVVCALGERLRVAGRIGKSSANSGSRAVDPQSGMRAIPGAILWTTGELVPLAEAASKLAQNDHHTSRRASIYGILLVPPLPQPLRSHHRLGDDDRQRQP